MNEQEILTHLREAFRGGNLTLYLGAGVSAESRVPTWDALVAAMYFSAVYAEQRERHLRPYPNYIRAVAEWYLKRLPEPLEIVAQKVRQHYLNQHPKTADAFLESLRENLYPTLIDPETQRPMPRGADELRAGNRTLDAVASLAETQSGGKRGVRAVVTYNFDNLLEMALASLPHQPLWKGEQRRDRAKLPVFHVHGYVPLDPTDGGSGEAELIFSEDQYHSAAQDAYSWANVVQLKYMSGSTGLMVGLSATDRNMRRLLDAVRKTPIR